MENRIIKILENHKGAMNAIRIQDIQKKLHTEEAHTTCPNIRKAIFRIIKDHNIPVGSNNHGYFIIQTQAEFAGVMNLLGQKRDGIQRRMTAIRMAFKDKG